MITPRTILPAMLVFCAAVYAGNAPVTYNAVTDSAVRTQPPAPALAAAGTVVVDPTFGSKILRVTDGNTLPEFRNSGFLTPAGSFEVNWNSDTTMFWIHSKAGPLLFKFDAAAFRATPVPDPSNVAHPLVLPGSGPFSFRRPNIIYLTRGRTVAEYDTNTQAFKTVFDGNAAVPSAANYAYAPSVSDDENRICLAFGGQQDTYPYVAVLDRTTGKYKVLETVNSRLNGTPTNVTLGFGMHSAYMDRSGRYVIMTKGTGKVAGTSDWAVWDVDASRVYEIKAEWSGHDASGFGVRINQSGFFGGQPAFYEEQQWAIRGLSESEIDKYSYILDWQQLPSPHQPIYSGHHSWNNARADAMVPVVGSIVRDSSQAAKPWRLWDNEIIGVATDGSKKVYRFAHHFSKWDRSNFWDDPRGNISQDGRFFVFTSNWDKSLGADPDGGVRHDVFIVALSGAADASVTPASPASPTSPASPASPASNGAKVTTLSGASFALGPVAPGSIAAGFGHGLSARTAAPSSRSLGTNLADTTVSIKDATGAERLALIYYVGPGQINYIVPDASAPGLAAVTVTSAGRVTAAGSIEIQPAAPGFFTATQDGKGLAAGQAITVRPDRTQTARAFATCTAALQCVAVPVSLGPVGSKVFLTLYGTGVRGRSSLAAVTATVGGVNAPVDYAGPQSQYVGLDQVNILVPPALAGRGEVDVVVTVDGKRANPVRVRIQ